MLLWCHRCSQEWRKSFIHRGYDSAGWFLSYLGAMVRDHRWYRLREFDGRIYWVGNSDRTETRVEGSDIERKGEAPGFYLVRVTSILTWHDIVSIVSWRLTSSLLGREKMSGYDNNPTLSPGWIPLTGICQPIPCKTAVPFAQVVSVLFEILNFSYNKLLFSWPKVTSTHRNPNGQLLGVSALVYGLVYGISCRVLMA